MKFEIIDQVDPQENESKIPEFFHGALLEVYEERLSRVIIGRAVINNDNSRADRYNMTRSSDLLTVILDGDIYRFSFYENGDIRQIDFHNLEREDSDSLKFNEEGQI